VEKGRFERRKGEDDQEKITAVREREKRKRKKRTCSLLNRSLVPLPSVLLNPIPVHVILLLHPLSLRCNRQRGVTVPLQASMLDDEGIEEIPSHRGVQNKPCVGDVGDGFGGGDELVERDAEAFAILCARGRISTSHEGEGMLRKRIGKEATERR
jgi:hypothetical protein